MLKPETQKDLSSLKERLNQIANPVSFQKVSTKPETLSIFGAGVSTELIPKWQLWSPLYWIDPELYSFVPRFVWINPRFHLINNYKT